MDSSRGLIVEQLTPVRHHAGFEEMAGVSEGRAVSVGVTNAGVFADQARADAFAAEVRKAIAFQHPNVARTIAIDGAGPLRWAVAWQRFEGVSLDRVIAEKGALLPDEAVSITMAVAHALAAAHQVQLVHGDVRPEWISVLAVPTSVEVRLAGFGLGLLPVFTAARKVSPSLDIAGLGGILHLLVTGKPPQGNLAGLPASAMHLGPVLTKSLGLDLSNRFRSVQEFIAALTDANRTRVSGGHVVVPAGGPSPVGIRKLGPWELVQLIGEGAMGQVFLGKHALLGRQAAIKVLRPEQYQRDDLIQRFFQEARAVNQINHEHIVEISDFGQELGPDGKPTAVYFVMELLQGETLTTRLAQGSLSIERSLHVVKQLASALAAAHRLGVVHRDVKTDNVFLINRHGDADYVKVLDFGVAKLTQPTEDAPKVSTMDGAIIGTPTSMSPEQASGGTVDRRADVYAVGVMLYQLLSGKLPIDGENFGKLVAALLTRQPDPLPPRTPQGEPIPPWLADVVRRCLEKDPAKRPQSMEELAQALSSPRPAADASLRRTEVVVPPGVDDEPKLPPSRRGAIAVGALVLLAAVGAGVAFWPKPPPVVPVVVDAGVIAVAAVDAGPAVAEVIDAGAEPEAVDAGADVVAEVVDAGAAVVDAGVVAVKKPVKPVVLTPALVLGAIDRQGLSKFRACAERFRTSLPAGGTIATNFTIEKSGDMGTVNITEPGLAEPLRACLQKAMSGIKFPLNTGLGRAVNYKIAVSEKPNP
ncbi:MAG: serine/threonine-protein kinase [Myxococcaceae bacterium]